jgi:pimeloyl-ACP methyl ester carboxylesterase
MTARTFVFVHGAWHGGWVFARVADMLRAQGHRVFTPTLTGLCDRSHLLHPGINCSTHVDDVLNLIKWEQLSDIVLVGWSYGGYVIAGVSDRIPDKIASLVYLDSIVPEDGKTMFETNLQPEGLVHFISSTGDLGGLVVPPLSAKTFGVIDPADAAMVDALCTPQPLATFTERMKYTWAYKGPKTCIYAFDWEIPLRAACDRVKNDKSYTVHVVEKCGHHIMLDAPDRLAELLLKAA